MTTVRQELQTGHGARGTSTRGKSAACSERVVAFTERVTSVAKAAGTAKAAGAAFIAAAMIAAIALSLGAARPDAAMAGTDGGQGGKCYTSVRVQPGETLWEIAERFKTEEYASVPDYIEEVREINHLSSDDIHAGQYIAVPYFAEDGAR